MRMNWLQRLSQGLTKTRDAVRSSLDRLISRGPDPMVLDELEAALIAADLGARTVGRLMDRLRAQARAADLTASAAAPRLLGLVQETILETLRSCEGEPIDCLVGSGPRPYVILAVGVNGVGKTTTVAKLAQRLRQEGKAPLLVAADTFRAAAIEQLEVWARRIEVPLIRHQQGADPAAVVFDGLATARARGVDVVLIDTAGRLHTKTNLMDELRKVKRVLARELPGAPHEVLLTLDATVGQNALSQARQFNEAIGVTGIVLTKLDGTARGGIVVAIAEELKIPVRLIGVGEAAEDLQDFRSREFVEAIFASQIHGPVL
ncbi:MAG TPA: signal recognition particle-docking protein FtsY [Nitrospiraceae bacterium]|nr:signal recognition particle-docking protein FtsY [Nitrospiraceae bacterium]